MDLTSLKKALTSLQKAIERYGRVPEDEEIRDSVIQRFETSYELCWKMLSKELQQRTPRPIQTPSLDFKSLMREGSRFGLIDDPEVWFEYRRMRNISSHTYDEATADRWRALQNPFLRMQNHCSKHWKRNDQSAFGTMKSDAILINTSRGGIICDKDL